MEFEIVQSVNQVGGQSLEGRKWGCVGGDMGYGEVDYKEKNQKVSGRGGGGNKTEKKENQK